MSDQITLGAPPIANVPLIGVENKRMQFQAFQQALDDLCNRGAGSGIPPQAISEQLLLAGLRGLCHISAMAVVGSILKAAPEPDAKPKADLSTEEGRTAALKS